MNILAIETSCDETSIAFVKATGGLRLGAKGPRFEISKNLVASQINIHRPWGGVVPMLAKREHLKNLPRIWKRIKTTIGPIDKIAVTVGPGLEPALWPGIEFAKALSKQLKKPLMGANHLEGHLYSFLESKNLAANTLDLKNIFPATALIVSGGHTILLAMDSLAKYKKLGETRDDAAGEAFDKVAKMMGLPYPGGPEIEKLARKGNPNAIQFPRPMLYTANNPDASQGRGPDHKRRGNYEFSFSGLKTAVLYYIRDHKKFSKADVAASFQEAVTDVLVKKTFRATREFGARSIILAGGVAMNKALSKKFDRECKKLEMHFFVPPRELLTDNAAMIGIAAYMNSLRRKTYRLVAQANLNLK